MTANNVSSTGSVTSLVAGLLFGVLAAVGAYLTSKNPRNVWLSAGEWVQVLNSLNEFSFPNLANLCSSLNAGTAGTLCVVMGLRFLGSWKFMPAGLMTLLR